MEIDDESSLKCKSPSHPPASVVAHRWPSPMTSPIEKYYNSLLMFSLATIYSLCTAVSVTLESFSPVTTLCCYGR
jgi:hypothetical protein